MSFLLAATAMDYLAVVLRFIHIMAAMAAGGAILFHWLAVTPALKTTAGDMRSGIASAIANRWRGVVYTMILLLLATGLTTFLVYRVPYYREHPQKAIYHGVFGVKLLAALLLFHGATVLTLSGPKGEKYRAKAAGRLAFMAFLLVIIVAAGAKLRYFETLYPWPGH
jgi:uncharacterized membrane protein